MLKPSKDLPNWFQNQLKSTLLPPHIDTHIIDAYKSNPDLFTNLSNRADENSKRPGFGEGQENLWIAANLTDPLNKGYPYNTCYYCGIEFNILNLDKIVMEHFSPKIHKPGNVVPSCIKCDEMKKDYTTQRFCEFFMSRDFNEYRDL